MACASDLMDDVRAVHVYQIGAYGVVLASARDKVAVNGEADEVSIVHVAGKGPQAFVARATP